MRAWRISRERHAATAFTGEGAALFPGRWNESGEAVVYCAESLALAALELLVNMERGELPTDLVSLSMELPDDAIEVFDWQRMPRFWRAYPHAASTQALGTQWLLSRSSLALIVPSAVIPTERVVLINPWHPRASEPDISQPVRFALDPRLAKP